MRRFAIATVFFLVLALTAQDAYGRPRRGGWGGRREHFGRRHHRPIVCDAVDQNTGNPVCAQAVTCPSFMQCAPPPAAENAGRRGRGPRPENRPEAVNITVSVCQPKICNIDADCPSGFSCQETGQGSTKRCRIVRNCTNDSSCPAGFVCDQDQTRGPSRCKPESCTSNLTCPADFYCSPKCGKCKPQKDNSCMESVRQLCEARGGCQRRREHSSEEGQDDVFPDRFRFDEEDDDEDDVFGENSDDDRRQPRPTWGRSQGERRRPETDDDAGRPDRPPRRFPFSRAGGAERRGYRGGQQWEG